MNYLDTAKRVQVIKALVEGMSVRATCRLTGVSKPTVLKLLVDVGEVCAAFQYEHLRNLKCKRVQVDEIWAFVAMKQKNVPLDARGQGVGDVWTWTAIDADTKLIVSFLVGNRDSHCARIFIDDLASRLAGRIQLTSDGHKPYLQAVEDAFGAGIDYAVIMKLYGNEGHGGEPANIRYSPAVCTGIKIEKITGRPDPAHISTSYVERQNLTMRMSMRRFTRLTNGFSKKAENHAAMVALHFMHYNFCRIHQTLRITPAMAAGVSGKVFDVEDIVALLEQAEAAREAELGPRRTRNAAAQTKGDIAP